MSVKEGRVRRCAFDRYHGVVAKRLQPYMLDVAASTAWAPDKAIERERLFCVVFVHVANFSTVLSLLTLTL